MAQEGSWSRAKVVRVTGLSPRSLAARVKAGTFPAPDEHGLWDAMAVDQYAIEHKPRQHQVRQPALVKKG